MLFSIVIPVYNVEDYLEKCLESVLQQDESDYEVILVDDGSTDGSAGICDRFAENYPDVIRVIHQENNGQGGARNTGLSAARGEYILFLDSDDYYLPGTLKSIKAGINQFSCDVFIFDFSIERNGIMEPYSPARVEYPLNKAFSPVDYPAIARLTIVTIEAWKKSLFDQILFPSRVWFEDLRMAPKLIAAAESIVVEQKPFYVYVQREGSTMHNADISRNAELFDAFDDLCDWFQETGKWNQYEQQIRQMAIEQMILSTIPRIVFVDKKHPLLARIADYMDKEFPKYWLDPASNKTLQRKVFIRCTHHRRFDMIAMLLKCRRVIRTARKVLK